LFIVKCNKNQHEKSKGGYWGMHRANRDIRQTCTLGELVLGEHDWANLYWAKDPGPIRLALHNQLNLNKSCIKLLQQIYLFKLAMKIAIQIKLSDKKII